MTPRAYPEHRECDADVPHVPLAVALDAWRRAWRRGITASENALRAVARDKPDAPCGFAGVVDVITDRDMQVWTCPWCDTQHEQQTDPDHDTLEERDQ